MKLYGYWRSSSAWRVRIGLGLKGIDYVNEPVHLVADGGRQHSASHLARNPMAQVPVLEVEHDGTTVYLSQSLAILTYLDAVQPAPPLVPSEPLARARAWQYAEVINAGIQPLQNLAVLKRIEALGGDRGAWGRRVIDRGLVAIEQQLSGRTAFLVGDHPTVADLCLVPQLYNARRFGLDLESYPALLAIEARCQALPAFEAAHPDRQPDAVLTP